MGKGRRGFWGVEFLWARRQGKETPEYETTSSMDFELVIQPEVTEGVF